MLLRPGAIPPGDGWAFELKYDGFRAIVSTENGLQVRSRRGWNMSERVSELGELPSGLVLDGELVAFNADGAPHWPLLVERVLHGNTAIPIVFVAFDLLRVGGHDVTCNPWSQRRTLLEGVWGNSNCARLADVFDDGQALVDAVVSYGLEGVVAKRRAGIYRSGQRGWVKVKNPTYWRRESEVELMRGRRDPGLTLRSTPDLPVVRSSGPRRQTASGGPGQAVVQAAPAGLCVRKAPER